MTHHLVIKIAYDGSSYFGWQATKEGPSIEATLKEVLDRVFSENICLRAASRTDRGVHAHGQVVDFFCSKIPKELPKIEVSLNQLLPSDIRCLSLYTAPYPSFHPTLAASSKIYRYYVSPMRVQKPHQRHTHWHIFSELDKALMRQSIPLLIGTHDCRGFCNTRPDLRENTTRTLYSIDLIEKPEEEELFFEIHGDRFLYKMVRNIVGTMIYIGQGKLDPSVIEQIFSYRKRACAGVTAPAHGLILWKVLYEDGLAIHKPNHG